MSATDDYLKSIQNSRDLTAQEKALILAHVPKVLVAATTTAAAQTQLLADAAKYKAQGVK